MTTNIEPEGWARPRGYANGVCATGTYLAVAGQIGWNERNEFVSDTFLAQAAQALKNVVAVVRAAGGEPENIVRLTWYVIDKYDYLGSARELGLAYREIMGAHYPAMTLIQAAALLEDRALVEIEATAILPA